MHSKTVDRLYATAEEQVGVKPSPVTSTAIAAMNRSLGGVNRSGLKGTLNVQPARAGQLLNTRATGDVHYRSPSSAMLPVTHFKVSSFPMPRKTGGLAQAWDDGTQPRPAHAAYAEGAQKSVGTSLMQDRPLWLAGSSKPSTRPALPVASSHNPAADRARAGAGARFGDDDDNIVGERRVDPSRSSSAAAVAAAKAGGPASSQALRLPPKTLPQKGKASAYIDALEADARSTTTYGSFHGKAAPRAPVSGRAGAGTGVGVGVGVGVGAGAAHSRLRPPSSSPSAVIDLDDNSGPSAAAAPPPPRRATIDVPKRVATRSGRMHADDAGDPTPMFTYPHAATLKLVLDQPLTRQELERAIAMYGNTRRAVEPETIDDSDDDIIIESLEDGDAVEDRDWLKTTAPAPAKKHFRSVTITKGDWERFLPGQYYNDSCIDWWSEVLYWRLIASASMREQCHICSSLFYKKLASGRHAKKQVDSEPPGRVAWRQVGRWTRHVSMFDKKFVMVPVNIALHWSLAIICNLDSLHDMLLDKFAPRSDDDAFDVEQDSDDGAAAAAAATARAAAPKSYVERPPCIIFLDSLKCHDQALVCNNLREYLWYEWVQRRNGGTDVPGGMAFLKSMVKDCGPHVPQQDNGCDCGVFVCQYAQSWIELWNTGKFGPPGAAGSGVTAAQLQQRLAKTIAKDWFDMGVVTRLRYQMKGTAETLGGAPQLVRLMSLPSDASTDGVVHRESLRDMPHSWCCKDQTGPQATAFNEYLLLQATMALSKVEAEEAAHAGSRKAAAAAPPAAAAAGGAGSDSGIENIESSVVADATDGGNSRQPTAGAKRKRAHGDETPAVPSSPSRPGTGATTGIGAPGSRLKSGTGRDAHDESGVCTHPLDGDASGTSLPPLSRSPSRTSAGAAAVAAAASSYASRGAPGGSHRRAPLPRSLSLSPEHRGSGNVATVESMEEEAAAADKDEVPRPRKAGKYSSAPVAACSSQSSSATSQDSTDAVSGVAAGKKRKAKVEVLGGGGSVSDGDGDPLDAPAGEAPPASGKRRRHS